MRLDCQLRAFNAEVTCSSTIALSPCSHSCPPTLVPSFGDDGKGCDGWRIALSSQDTSSPRTWRSSAISPSSFGPSLVILGRFPPQLGPWAYYSKWAGTPRSFGPTWSIYGLWFLNSSMFIISDFIVGTKILIFLFIFYKISPNFLKKKLNYGHVNFLLVCKKKKKKKLPVMIPHKNQ